MNYDLCDLLNRKIEAKCGHLDEFPKTSNAKNQSYAENCLEELDPDLFIKVLDDLNAEHEVFNFWLYRNGKVSRQIADFENSARGVMKELANLTFSNYPSIDLMYFSALEKIHIAKNKLLMIECCVRPSLDQMFTIKDLEKAYLPLGGAVFWKIIDRRNKNSYYQGVGSNSLHDFKWSRIK